MLFCKLDAGVFIPERSDRLPVLCLIGYLIPECIMFGGTQILGCKVLPYSDRWKVIDSLEAVPMLQKELDKIDGPFDETKRAGDQAECSTGRVRKRQTRTTGKAVQRNAARDK
jgi:hypothetical protein